LSWKSNCKLTLHVILKDITGFVNIKTMHRLLVIALVVVAGCLSVNGDITYEYIDDGDCVCLTPGSNNLRYAPVNGVCGSVISTVHVDSGDTRRCFTYNGRNEWCNLTNNGRTRGHRFFRVDYGRWNAWVAGSLLNADPNGNC